MKKPPKIAQWILSITNRKGNRETVLGDFQEFYEQIKKDSGSSAANIWYWSQAFKSLPKFILSSIYWGAIMLKNYFTLAVRNIYKHKGYSAINIFGLAVGLASFLLMLLWIQEELSFDSFHTNGDQIYRVISELHSNDGKVLNAKTPNALAPELKNEFPEIVDFIRYQGYEGWFIKANDKTLADVVFGVAEPQFFKMFSFPFIVGNPETALQDESSIVITERMGKKYFGDKNPIGEIITLMGSEPFKVTGIIKDIPENSHIQFDCMIPVSNIARFNHQDFASWGQTFFYTYIQTAPNISLENLNNKISGFLEKYIPNNSTKLFLQPLKDVHLRSDYESDLDNYRQGNIQYVYIFLCAAFCILLVACINYTNLSTAKSFNRLKEVGMRKVIGSSRKSLVFQFISESMLMCLIAAIIAIGLIALILPTFNDFTGNTLSLNFTTNKFFIISVLLVTLLTGVMAGSYPALFVSSFKPIQILKSSEGPIGGKTGWLRKGLVITQFVLTSTLFVISLTMNKQLNYIHDKDLGYNKECIVRVTNYMRSASTETLREELLQYPGITNVTFSGPPFARYFRPRDEYNWEGKNPNEVVLTNTTFVDHEYLNTFGIKLIEGKFFSNLTAADDSCFVLNETAAKRMNIKNPIGKKLTYTNPYYGTVKGEIIGVVKDYHHSSLHDPIEPVVMASFDLMPYLCVKMDPKDVAGSINHIQSLWKKYANSDFEFSYNFIDEDLDKYYTDDNKVASAFRVFTSITLLISCLGLLGLVSFMTVTRSKEIGIRKVLGASVSGLIVLLSKEFIKWVLIANIIALPIAYLLINKWLEDFAFRIQVDYGLFLVVLLFTIALTMITVIYKTRKAASINPIDSIKYE